MTKLQKIVIALTAIITIQLQLFVRICRPTPKVAEVAGVEKAVVITATIEEEELLIVP